MVESLVNTLRTAVVAAGLGLVALIPLNAQSNQVSPQIGLKISMNVLYLDEQNIIKAAYSHPSKTGIPEEIKVMKGDREIPMTKEVEKQYEELLSLRQVDWSKRGWTYLDNPPSLPVYGDSRPAIRTITDKE